uniref:Ald_Xan_dh_C2 domain-containing protein n=1 Tax=Ascaris lumbricoides TaxID=6252 RepID=A0A0M3HUJ5_ASCLU
MAVVDDAGLTNHLFEICAPVIYDGKMNTAVSMFNGSRRLATSRMKVRLPDRNPAPSTEVALALTSHRARDAAPAFLRQRKVSATPHTRPGRISSCSAFTKQIR